MKIFEQVTKCCKSGKYGTRSFMRKEPIFICSSCGKETTLENGPWEHVADNLIRIKVPGGFIYRSWKYVGEEPHETGCSSKYSPHDTFVSYKGSR